MSEILTAVREKRRQLETLRAQVAALEEELREISNTATGKAQQRLPLKRPRLGGGAIQPGSSTDWAKRTLVRTGRPMTVEDIILEIVKEGGQEFQKATLVSNLSRYVNRRDTFVRVSPNVYGLLEMEGVQGNGANQEASPV